MAAIYTSVERVVSLLGMVDENGARWVADANTIPSSAEITEFIEDAEDDFERDCNTAWKEVTVTDEYHTTPKTHHSRYKFGVQLQLGNRHIRSITSVEVWNNSSWDTLATEGTGPFDGDYYVSKKDGLLYIHNDYPSAYYENGIKISYTYGQTSIPNSVRRAITCMASAYIIESGLDWVHELVSPTGGISNKEKSDLWMARAKDIANKNRTMIPIPQH